MLEGEEGEENMEKSAGRQSSVPPRPNGQDSSKKDGTNRRRSNKWRDNNNGRPKSDAPQRRTAQQQQQQQQQNRPADKRPRSRGYNNDRQKQKVTEEEEADYGSVFRPGSKKQNYNHLLNFSYGGSPRDGDGSYHHRGGGGGGWPKKKGNWASRRNHVRYNKEQFLQANCQFVVQEACDFSIHSADPDILVEWGFIEQVRLYGHGVPSCPICLYPPTAAKMTRCGHIYCWSCILHYLSLSEKSWAKCPICFESVHENDLKSVKALDMPAVSVGDTLTMTLMKRTRGSTYAAPVYQWLAEHVERPQNVDDDGDSTRFSKLLTARTEQIQAIVQREKEELMQQMQEEGKESLEGSYIEAAMQALTKREKKLGEKLKAQMEVTEMMHNLSVHAEDEGEVDKDEEASPKAATPAKPVLTYASAFSDDEEAEEKEEEEELVSAGQATLEKDDSTDVQDSSGHSSPKLSLGSEGEEAVEQDAKVAAEEEIEGLTVEEAAQDLAMPTEEEDKPIKQANKITEIYYFYQASDGQQIYLHSLNARCLVREYGSLEQCPPNIQANITDVEGISMSQELRPRLRYLSHLPLTCEFQVVELALKPPLVSKETLEIFREETDRRYRQRQKRQREERHKLKKMQEDENKRMQQCPQLRASLGGIQNPNFPEMRSVIVPSEAPSLQQQNSNMSASSSPMTLTPVGSPPTEDTQDNGGQTSLSFAQMLRAGKARPQDPASSTKSSSAWPGSPGSKAVKSPDSDSDSEDRVPVPEYHASFGDAIQAALNKATSGTEKADDPIATGGGGGKKKKKKVKQLLFSTSMNRAK